MSTLVLPIATLVRDNTSVLMTFAFSRPQLERLLSERFQGEWEALRDTLLGMPRARAERACLELALLLRYLDDESDINSFVTQRTNFDFGTLYYRDKDPSRLQLRDVSNKIIHARSLEWRFDDPSLPKLIAYGRDSERWERAEIDVLYLVAVCGNLADQWRAA
jgi:hypothetical protein